MPPEQFPTPWTLAPEDDNVDLDREPLVDLTRQELVLSPERGRPDRSDASDADLIDPGGSR